MLSAIGKIFGRSLAEFTGVVGKGVVGLLARSFKGWRCPVSWFADDVFSDMI